MKEIKVDAVSKRYTVYIRNDFSGLPETLEQKGLINRKVCIIADTNVSKLYMREVKELLLGKYKHVSEFVHEAGEKHKTLSTVKKIYEFLLNNKMDRSSLVVALGGGVTGDMAGFAASTYMRGIPFIQLPTTLLSQVDSSVGGKTGVDFMGNKNIIGTFAQPELVYINYSTLKTLPKEQFSSGMAEVIKHGLISDVEYYKFLSDSRDKIRALEEEEIERVIHGSCVIKASVVAKDEKESGIREILNFGHTFGHAFEALSNFDIMHGEGVALGMSAALNMSHRLGYINEDELAGAEELIKYFGLPSRTFGLNVGDVCAQMYLDKKTVNNMIRLILLKKMGEAFIYEVRDKDTLSEAVAHVSEQPEPKES